MIIRLAAIESRTRVPPAGAGGLTSSSAGPARPCPRPPRHWRGSWRTHRCLGIRFQATAARRRRTARISSATAACLRRPAYTSTQSHAQDRPERSSSPVAPRYRSSAPAAASANCPSTRAPRPRYRSGLPDANPEARLVYSPAQALREARASPGPRPAAAGRRSPLPPAVGPAPRQHSAACAQACSALIRSPRRPGSSGSTSGGSRSSSRIVQARVAAGILIAGPRNRVAPGVIHPRPAAAVAWAWGPRPARGPGRPVPRGVACGPFVGWAIFASCDALVTRNTVVKAIRRVRQMRPRSPPCGHRPAPATDVRLRRDPAGARRA